MVLRIRSDSDIAKNPKAVAAKKVPRKRKDIRQRVTPHLLRGFAPVVQEESDGSISDLDESSSGTGQDGHTEPK